MKLRQRRSDAGFTLVELTLVMVILGVIMFPLTNLAFEGFHYYATTQTKFADSHDIQITTAYFSQDVANTGSRDYTTGDPVNGTSQQSVWAAGTFPSSYCGRGLGNAVVLLTWDTISATVSGGNQTVSRERDSVAYIAYSDSTLHRVFCPGSAIACPSTGCTSVALPLSTTVTTNATMAHNYYFGDPSNQNPISCSTTCTSATVPATISFKLSIKGQTDSTPTYVTLTGDRRQT